MDKTHVISANGFFSTYFDDNSNIVPKNNWTTWTDLT